MKYLFLIIFLNLAFYGYAQKKIEVVNQNNEKIDELNDRLNNLVKESKEIPLDSNSYKIDLLINEIGELKKEMQDIRQSVDELYQNNQESLTDSGMKKISQGEYYIVIDSERRRVTAEIKMEELKKLFDVKLVQNTKKTWYHIVIAKPYSLANAIEETAIIRPESINDAWWISVKKIIVQ